MVGVSLGMCAGRELKRSAILNPIQRCFPKSKFHDVLTPASSFGFMLAIEQANGEKGCC